MKHLIELSHRKRYLLDKYVNEALYKDHLKHIILIDKRQLLVDLSFIHKSEEVDICRESKDFEDWLNEDSDNIDNSVIIVESYNDIKHDHLKFLRIQTKLHELTLKHNLVILLD